MAFPYENYRNSKIWDVIKTAIDELEKNEDIEYLTPKEYVIGFICKKLTESLLLKNNCNN